MTTRGVGLRPCRQPELVDLLASQTEEATDRLVTRVVEEIPLYRTLDAVQLADVRATVRAGWVATLDLWRSGRLASSEELARFRANGASRAAEGRPLPLVLRAYRVSGLAIYDHVVAHPEARLDPEEERNLARLTMAFVDQLSNEVTLGYVEATGQLGAQQGQARRELLEDLLAGRFLASTEVVERAATLGMTAPMSPVLVIAAPRPGDASLLVDRARTALRDLAQLRPDAARWHVLTRGQLVLVHDDDVDGGVVRRALEGAGLIGVRLRVGDLAEVARAYGQARAVHDLLVTAVLPPLTWLEHGETLALGLLARVREDVLAEQVRSELLGDLRTPANAVLLETLDAYLASGNAVAAAHRLGVHAQTMRYRLARIRALTGRDPSEGWDRFLLQLALRTQDRPTRQALRRPDRG